MSFCYTKKMSDEQEFEESFDQEACDLSPIRTFLDEVKVVDSEQEQKIAEAERLLARAEADWESHGFVWKKYNASLAREIEALRERIAQSRATYEASTQKIAQQIQQHVLAEQSADPEYDYLPDDRNYYLLPNRGDEVELLVTQALVEEYLDYDELAPDDINKIAARQFQALIDQACPSLTAQVREVSCYWLVEIENQDTVRLVDDQEGLIDVTGSSIPGKDTGPIYVSNVTNLAIWNPEEHVVHKIISDPSNTRSL